VVKEGVAAVQYPAVAGVDRHAGVTAGVAGQRDQRDARRYLRELLCRGESAPLLTVRGVLDDLGAVRPQDRAEAEPFTTRRGPQRAERLCGGDVYLGLGKVAYAADMVAVEVRDDDVAHVVAVKAELLDLMYGGLLTFEHRADEVSGRSHPTGGVVAVLRAEAGVDQNQTVAGLDQQHVAYQLTAPGRVHGSAVEVMNLHASSLLDRCRLRGRVDGHRCMLVPALPLDGGQVERPWERGARDQE
jgi:hypothetical protein